MTKTIENLKAAITGESTASATYAAYAAKAAQEGQPLIQKLFEAASKAESVHAANHNKDRKSTRLNSSHWNKSRMPSSA